MLIFSSPIVPLNNPFNFLSNWVYVGKRSYISQNGFKMKYIWSVVFEMKKRKTLYNNIQSIFAYGN